MRGHKYTGIVNFSSLVRLLSAIWLQGGNLVEVSLSSLADPAVHFFAGRWSEMSVVMQRNNFPHMTDLDAEIVNPTSYDACQYIPLLCFVHADGSQ